MIQDKPKDEVYRIFNETGLDMSHYPIVRDICFRMESFIGEGCRFKNFSLLAPCTTYLYFALKYNSLKICPDKQGIIEHSPITEIMFDDFVLQILNYKEGLSKNTTDWRDS